MVFQNRMLILYLILLVFNSNISGQSYKWTIPPVLTGYDTFRYFPSNCGNYFIVQKNNLYGLVDTFGKLVIPTQYIKLEIGSNCLVYTNLPDKKNVLFNIKGKNLSESYDEYNFADSLIIVKKGNLFGAIDHNGNITIPIIYNSYESSNSEYIFRRPDTTRRVSIKLKEKNYFDFKLLNYKYLNNCNSYVKNGKYGILNSKGDTLTKPIYIRIEVFLEGNADGKFVKCFTTFNKFEILDTGGKVWLKDDYSNVYNIRNDTFIVTKNKQYGIIDLKNNTILPMIYKNIYAAGNYIVCVADSISELRDLSLKLIQGMAHKSISNSKNTFIYHDNGNRGYYNMDNKKLFPPVYEKLNCINEKICQCTKGNKVNLISTKDGQEILKTDVDKVQVISNGILLIEKSEDKENRSLIDINGKLLFDFKDHEVTIISNQYIVSKLTHVDSCLIIDCSSFKTKSLYCKDFSFSSKAIYYLYFDNQGKRKIAFLSDLFKNVSNSFNMINEPGDDFITFNEFLITFRKNNFGLYKNSSELIPPIFEGLKYHMNDYISGNYLFYAKKNGKWGVISVKK